ncbi:MAG: hypothetical protein J3K34DRAFT_522680 [Monoraphidium minutum]|nr:MAG: hypothetical protein J3K34DRAFT_522680 [Monoraphidium minutum]
MARCTLVLALVVAGIAVASAADGPRRQLLGSKARPFGNDHGARMGVMMNMMDTQSAIQRASDSYGGYTTAAVATSAGWNAQNAAYGGYGGYGYYGRKLLAAGRKLLGAAAAKGADAAKDAKAMPWSYGSGFSTDMNMMGTQAAVMRASDSYGGYSTAAVANGAGWGTQNAAYGGWGGGFGRRMLGEKAAKAATAEKATQSGKAMPYGFASEMRTDLNRMNTQFAIDRAAGDFGGYSTAAVASGAGWNTQNAAYGGWGGGFGGFGRRLRALLGAAADKAAAAPAAAATTDAAAAPKAAPFSLGSEFGREAGFGNSVSAASVGLGLGERSNMWNNVGSSADQRTIGYAFGYGFGGARRKQ